MKVCRLWLVPLVVALALMAPGAVRPAHAQMHYDVAFNSGVSKRFLSGGSLGGSFGPVIGLSGDVALMPLVRVGVYVNEEMAFDGEPKAPFITSFGGRVKFLPPLGDDRFRAWIFVGIGYAILSAPGYHQTIPLPNAATTTIVDQDVTTASASGSFLEIPFGLGGSYRLRAPWVLLAEVSGRAGLASGGGYFDPTGRNATVTKTGDPIGLVTGTESFALLFTVGIGLDL